MVFERELSMPVTRTLKSHDYSIKSNRLLFNLEWVSATIHFFTLLLEHNERFAERILFNVKCKKTQKSENQ